MAAKNLLIIEDERDLAEMLAYNLRKAGYTVNIEFDGTAGLAAIRRDPPDLVILDLMLPGIQGAEVARQVRTTPATARLPILMLTAKAEESDQVAGLATGADDYVTKPYSTKVVIARVEALLRRAAGAAGTSTGGGAMQIRVGPVQADLAVHAVTVEGAEIKLTLTEFKLLVALLQAPKRVLSRADLIARVMGPGIVITSRTIDVHIAAIRKKLGDYGEMIRTIRGVGYQLSPPMGWQDDTTPAHSAATR
jgi:two-component system phosphate regulon response regulator PhoB